MANEQSGCPLRRWRPFYGAFGAIDDGIEAAGHARAAFQDARVRIVKLLRAATDDGVAEQLCAALDDAMAESLETLRVAPVPRSVLVSTDLAGAVGALGNHGSARIRTLARDVVRGWAVAIDGGATAAKEEPDKLSGDSIPHQQSISTATAAAEAHKMKLHIPAARLLSTATVAATKKLHVPLPPPKIAQGKKLEAKKLVVAEAKKPVVADRIPHHQSIYTATAAEAHKMKVHVPAPSKLLSTATVAPTKKLHVPLPKIAQSEKLDTKKLVVAQSEKVDAKKPVITRSDKIEAKKPIVAESSLMETTKRKLREGYQEAEKLKRQHTIQKIDDKEAPKLLKRSLQKMHRVPARCQTRTSSTVVRSLLPSLQLI